MTITSYRSAMENIRWNRAGAAGPTLKTWHSNIEQQSRRFFQRFLDRDEREHRLAPVDDPVIVRLREIVHRPDHDLAVLDHRTVLGRVDPENRRLRRVDDRRRQHRAEDAAVADRVRAAGQL